MPDYKENLNPVCEICFGAHKTSQHEELQPKTNEEKLSEKIETGVEKKDKDDLK